MKRLLALLLAFACSFFCLPPTISQAEEASGEMPVLRIDVSYDNMTDDGQADAKITVYYFRGSGTYQQNCMENLRVTLQCRNGLKADRTEFDLDSPSSFQQVYVHLTYEDPGAACRPDENIEERPILEVHATTLNCGEADYKCYFDARSKARVFPFYHNKGVGLADQIANSYHVIVNDFLTCNYQYNRMMIGPISENPENVFVDLGKIRDFDIDENDITYIYICCHGREVDGEPTGEILMRPGIRDTYPKIDDILRLIDRLVPGRVVVFLDCCFSGKIIESAYQFGIDSDRMFIASATTSFLRSASAEANLGGGEARTGFSSLLHSVYKKDKAYITCNDLVEQSTGFYQMLNKLYQAFMNISANLLEKSIDLFLDGYSQLDPVFRILKDKFDFSAEAFFHDPHNMTLPMFFGNVNLPLFVKDETYDDGYHRLVVYDTEMISSRPRYISTQVLDEDTGEEIPDAKVTVYDTDGYAIQEQVDSKGRWSRVLTDKTIRLLFTAENHENTWKLLGNEKTIAELTEEIEDPTEAVKKAAEVETNDTFFVRMKGSVASFYIYLRDHVVPQIGLVGADPVPVRAYELADSMIRNASGLVCAAVCDLNGDGQNEMVTVTAGKIQAQYDPYGYGLNLYGRSPETGNVELWDTAENVARADAGTGSGYLSVHIQRSENTVYIICYAYSGNFDSTEWDYKTTRIYRVEGQKIVDITDYEGFVRGNSGISLSEPQDTRTALCYADLQWETGRTTDYTHLAEYLRDVDSSRQYSPVKVDLEDYTQSKGIERARVDQLIREIEENVCSVIHQNTSQTGDGQTEYAYSTALDCGLYITARNSDGAITSVTINDSAHYDQSLYLDHMNQYLDTDMTGELKRLLACVFQSEALKLSDAERFGLATVPLIGNQRSNLDQINFYNKRLETVGSVVLEAGKAVYTAGATSNNSYVLLTFSPASAEKEPAPPAKPDVTQEPATPAPVTPPPAVSGPTVATAAAALPSIVFTPGSFVRDQKLAVYAAPSSKAWRGANGKAKVSTNDTVWVAGYSGKWLLVMYETSGGSVRIGYIDSEKLKGTPPAAETLALTSLSVTLTEAASVTDDPSRSASIIRKLKKGASVTLLAQWNDWAYVETKADGKTARGFIPLNTVNP